jgi:hypothetical protein
MEINPLSGAGSHRVHVKADDPPGQLQVSPERTTFTAVVKATYQHS